MAFVALLGEGPDVEPAIVAVLEARGAHVSVLTRLPGACVIKDTNVARECVRDIKARMTCGRLFVFSLDEPQEVFAPGEEK